jgi:hypothetical protein
MATCAMKMENYHKSISILNEIKRNQLNKTLKFKALLMRMKIYRKT